MDIKEEWTKIIIYLSVLIIISAVIIGYVLFFNFKKCENEDCFFGSLQGCKKSYWIREDNLSTWLYQIESPVSTKSCKVKVKLLKIKEGSILNEDLEGEIMYCNLIRNEIRYQKKFLNKNGY